MEVVESVSGHTVWCHVEEVHGLIMINSIDNLISKCIPFIEKVRGNTV